MAPLSVPTFPRFHSLVHPQTFEVAEVASEPRAGRRPEGLFKGLLGGDFTALHQDAIEHPTKYDSEAVALLQSLVQGEKKSGTLTTGEQRLLDRATLDFASYVSPRQAAPKKPSVPKVSSKTRAPVEAPPLPGVDIPATETPAYWWLR